MIFHDIIVYHQNKTLSFLSKEMESEKKKYSTNFKSCSTRINIYIFMLGESEIEFKQMPKIYFISNNLR